MISFELTKLWFFSLPKTLFFITLELVFTDIRNMFYIDFWISLKVTINLNWFDLYHILKILFFLFSQAPSPFFIFFTRSCHLTNSIEIFSPMILWIRFMRDVCAELWNFCMYLCILKVLSWWWFCVQVKMLRNRLSFLWNTPKNYTMLE